MHFRVHLKCFNQGKGHGLEIISQCLKTKHIWKRQNETCFVEWWTILDDIWLIWLKNEHLLLWYSFSMFSTIRVVQFFIYLFFFKSVFKGSLRLWSFLLFPRRFLFFFYAGCNTYSLNHAGTYFGNSWDYHQGYCYQAEHMHILLSHPTRFRFLCTLSQHRRGNMLPLLLAELDKYYNGLFSAAEAHSVMIIQNLNIS